MTERRLRPAADAEYARWILDQIHVREYTVRGLVPPVFEAYARAFHHANLWEGREEPEERKVRWREVANLLQARYLPGEAIDMWRSE